MITALSRVRLTPSATARFPDLAGRDGVVLRVDGGVVVRWRGVDGETTVMVGDLEVIGT